MNEAASRDTREGFASRVLEAEAAAIRRIPIGDSFAQAVNVVLGVGRQGGSVVVSGLGKSGLIGQKLSATFSSTGTPSHFLHPVEAMHGDLGRVKLGDGVLLLSYGGNTQEIVTLAELLKQDEVPVIGMTSRPECDLGRLATVCLCIGDVTEACPHNLAPTASTAAMLALGDALALAVSHEKGFGPEAFRKFHPGGGLGRQLMPVVQAMRFRAGRRGREGGAGGERGEAEGNLPLIPGAMTVEEAYREAERYAQQSGLRRAGAILVVDEAGRLAGIFTDGDLRTALIRRGGGVMQTPIAEVMTRTPTTLPDTAQVRDAVQVVRERRFDEIPIVRADGTPVGLIDVQDLAALKVIEG